MGGACPLGCSGWGDTVGGACGADPGCAADESLHCRCMAECDPTPPDCASQEAWCPNRVLCGCLGAANPTQCVESSAQCNAMNGCL